MVPRITVNLTASTQAALNRYVAREGCTLTYALGRLVACGDIMYEAAHIDGAEVLTRRGDAVERLRFV